jgi:hypothetical protein
MCGTRRRCNCWLALARVRRPRRRARDDERGRARIMRRASRWLMVADLYLLILNALAAAGNVSGRANPAARGTSRARQAGTICSARAARRYARGYCRPIACVRALVIAADADEFRRETWFAASATEGVVSWAPLATGSSGGLATRAGRNAHVPAPPCRQRAGRAPRSGVSRVTGARGHRRAGRQAGRQTGRVGRQAGRQASVRR